MDTRRLLCVTAHPDDESLGFGGALAHYAAHGVETTLVVATRGERGWTGPIEENQGLHARGKIREAETCAAAGSLGIDRVAFLGFVDGEMDRADPADIVARLVAVIRDARPDVVVTFGLEGAYGHPGHVAISQFTTAATIAAADPAFPRGNGGPHRVAKLFHRVWTIADGRRFEDAFGPTQMEVDGVIRGDVELPEWLPSARLDTSGHGRQVRDAVATGRSSRTRPCQACPTSSTNDCGGRRPAGACSAAGAARPKQTCSRGCADEWGRPGAPNGVAWAHTRAARILGAGVAGRCSGPAPRRSLANRRLGNDAGGGVR